MLRYDWLFLQVGEQTNLLQTTLDREKTLVKKCLSCHSWISKVDRPANVKDKPSARLFSREAAFKSAISRMFSSSPTSETLETSFRKPRSLVIVSARILVAVKRGEQMRFMASFVYPVVGNFRKPKSSLIVRGTIALGRGQTEGGVRMDGKQRVRITLFAFS